jgi:integrase
MIALLALCPIRLKNFAVLEIGRTFVPVNETLWIVLAASETREGRPDERPVKDYLKRWIDGYLTTHRPVVARTDDAPSSLWLSSNDGRPMTYSAVESAISHTTSATIGIEISPHMFRTAGASSCAVYASDHPHLASALLHHTDSAVTQKHNNRASSLSAAESFAEDYGSAAEGPGVGGSANSALERERTTTYDDYRPGSGGAHEIQS